MSDKKVTDVLLDRVKYFINAIENGEYEPKGYEFTIILHSEPNFPIDKILKIEDFYQITQM